MDTAYRKALTFSIARALAAVTLILAVSLALL